MSRRPGPIPFVYPPGEEELARVESDGQVSLLAGGGVSWPPEVDHLSASSISRFLRCPESWRRRYLLSERERSTGSQVIGTACHAAQETNYRQKMESHEDMPVSDVEDAYAAAFDAAVDDRGGASEVVWDANPRGASKDLGAGMVRPYRLLAAPSVQPTAVEESFRFQVPGAPVPIIGRVDLEGRIVVPGKNGGETRHDVLDATIDMKFGGRVSYKLAPGERLQGLVYMLARSGPVHFHFTSYSGRVTQPPEHPLVVPYNRGSQDAARLLIERAVEQISMLYVRYGPDRTWPGALAHTWACSSCSYQPTCPYWGGAGGPLESL